jgi:hypothetical protein
MVDDGSAAGRVVEVQHRAALIRPQLAGLPLRVSPTVASGIVAFMNDELRSGS